MLIHQQKIQIYMKICIGTHVINLHLYTVFKCHKTIEDIVSIAIWSQLIKDKLACLTRPVQVTCRKTGFLSSVIGTICRRQLRMHTNTRVYFQICGRAQIVKENIVDVLFNCPLGPHIHVHISSSVEWGIQ